MESFNKVLSFILGLVVVVVFLAVVSGRIDLRKQLSSLPKKGILSVSPASTSPTPTVEKEKTGTTNKTATIGPTPKTNYNRYQTGKVNSIPNTGSPTIVLPIVFSSLLAGVWLKKRG